MKKILVLLMVLAICGVANAAVVAITNGGFEGQAPALAPGAVVNDYWTGWNCWAPTGYTPTSNKGFGVRNAPNVPQGALAYPVIATEGGNYGILGRIDTLQATYDYAWQSTVVIAADTVYTLKFDIAGITAAPQDEFITGSLFSSAAAGTLGGSIAYYTDLPNGEVLNGDYTWKTDKTVTWSSAGAGSSEVGKYLQIHFIGNRVCVDNVRLEATVVPEPATMAILGLGSLLAMRRRRA